MPQTSETRPLPDAAAWQAIESYLTRCLSLHHDINNPLAGVLGYCELLLSDTSALPPQTENYLRKVQGCGLRIQGLTEEMARMKRAVLEQIDGPNSEDRPAEAKS